MRIKDDGSLEYLGVTVLLSVTTIALVIFILRFSYEAALKKDCWLCAKSYNPHAPGTTYREIEK